MVDLRECHFAIKYRKMVYCGDKCTNGTCVTVTLSLINSFIITELFGAGCDKFSSFLSHKSSSKIFALVTCLLRNQIQIVFHDLSGSDQWQPSIYSKHASAITKGTDTSFQ